MKLDILLSGKPIDALSFIVHKDKASPAHGQIHHGAHVVGRDEDLRLQVGLLHVIDGARVGRDITRKRKLLEKQKAGKKRMKAIGNVEVPQEAFMAILKVDE